MVRVLRGFGLTGSIERCFKAWLTDFDLPTMFAALVMLALLGVVLFWIVDRIERLVIPWHVSQRQDVIFAA